MSFRFRVLGFLLLANALLLPGLLSAATRASADYTLEIETLDSGGTLATSANYSQDGSVGLIVGTASVAAPLEMIKGGYIAQIDDFGAPPSITTPPTGLLALSGHSASFSVLASGADPLSYQWLKNGSSLTGATQGTFTIASASSADIGAYSVTVSNPFGSISSAQVPLLVVDSVPTAQRVTVGDEATFTIAVSGSGSFSYQWFKDGNAIPGATTGTFSIPVSAQSDAGDYAVAVTDTYGTVTTVPVHLTVSTPVPAISAMRGTSAWRPKQK